MRKLSIFIGILFLVSATAGCQSSDTRATEGTIIGGLLGATAGGIVGHQSGHGLEGAGIGAAAGALTGAIVGSNIKKQGHKGGSSAQAANPNQMTMQQIVDMTKQGINENVIIDKIRLTNSKFSLSPQEVGYLKEQGVSQDVINTMQEK